MTTIKDQLLEAQKIAAEVFGTNPPPEIIAAVMNAQTAQKLDARFEHLADDICRAAAVAAGA